MNPKKSELVPIEEQEKRLELLEEVGRQRLRGKYFTDIARNLNLDSFNVKKLYAEFLDVSKGYWLRNKGKIVSELNEAYRQKMFNAEEAYRSCAEQKNSPGMAVWHKIMLETIQAYTAFLKDIGYINEATVMEIDDTLSKQDTDPLLLLINEHKKYLSEKIQKEEAPK
jgi:hypothetical protein